jgi:hypothetical protein
LNLLPTRHAARPRVGFFTLGGCPRFFFTQVLPLCPMCQKILNTEVTEALRAPCWSLRGTEDAENLALNAAPPRFQTGPSLSSTAKSSNTQLENPAEHPSTLRIGRMWNEE